MRLCKLAALILDQNWPRTRISVLLAVASHGGGMGSTELAIRRVALEMRRSVGGFVWEQDVTGISTQTRAALSQGCLVCGVFAGEVCLADRQPELPLVFEPASQPCIWHQGTSNSLPIRLSLRSSLRAADGG